MSTEDDDPRATIARHERETDEVQEHVKTLEDGSAKEKVEAGIRGRMDELEADLKL